MKRSCVTAILAACGLALATASSAEAQWHNPWNPVVHNSGQWAMYHGWNPWTGHTSSTHQTTVNASAYDPNRWMMDPGSLRYHNEWVPNGYGGWTRQTGTSWTSNGVYHHNMNQQTTQHTPWGTTTHNHHNIRSKKPNR